MNIDLGYLGKVVLVPYEERFTFDQVDFVLDGYTEDGIRVHAVHDPREYVTYPRCWRDAILIRL